MNTKRKRRKKGVKNSSTEKTMMKAMGIKNKSIIINNTRRRLSTEYVKLVNKVTTLRKKKDR